MSRLALTVALPVALWAVSALATPRAHGCAFSQTPTTYEAMRDRTAYLLGLELAGFNLIRPSDTFFGIPTVETGTRGNRTAAAEPYAPPVLLKAIGWIESNLAQAASSVPWGAVGPALISFDCGHGIMQITSGMTSPADAGIPSTRQALVATHYLFNIARGSAILVEKWNAAPEFRPVAGTDTGSDPTIVENWYFAVWGYNGFTGPGANRSNHPMDPIYAAWPRTGFSCGPADDGFGHRYGDYPYQELVYGCASRPPSVAGQTLWTAPAVPFALPDLNDSRWSGPLSLDNWVPCARSLNCAAMDIPTPLPSHNDQTARPADGTGAYLLGSPTLVVSRSTVSEPVNVVTISNGGQGILAWRARAGRSWITLDKQAGVALSPDVPCSVDAPCQRSPTLTIRANRTGSSGWVEIESLTTGQVVRISVVTDRFDVSCDGLTNPVDAALVLQHTAGLLATLPCPENADANEDGVIDARDAAIILQFSAGLLD